MNTLRGMYYYDPIYRYHHGKNVPAKHTKITLAK